MSTDKIKNTSPEIKESQQLVQLELSGYIVFGNLASTLKRAYEVKIWSKTQKKVGTGSSARSFF